MIYKLSRNIKQNKLFQNQSRQFSNIEDKKVIQQQKVQQQVSKQQTVQYKNVKDNKNELLQKIKEITLIDYKEYPYNIKHNDPKSKEYVYCEQSEIQQKNSTDAYNEMIKNLKLSIQMQELVYEQLERIDRPYKRNEGIRGVNINRFDKLEDYGKVQKGMVQSLQDEDEKSLSSMRNENRWVDQMYFEHKGLNELSHQKEYLQMLAERPVEGHFNSHKGYKYDVEMEQKEKTAYLADRLGHPELMGSPIERLFRLESELYHPNYLDQPFVLPPNPSTQPELCFEEGEVIYENGQLLEWSNFLKSSFIMGYLSVCYFVPLNYLFFSHTPLEIATSKSYLQPHDVSFFYFDKFGLHIPLMAALAYYSSYICLRIIDDVSKDYVVKMQYSKDKELLFVTRLSYFGQLSEEVHELHHLELLPPCIRTDIANHSHQHSDGLYQVYSLNGMNNLVLYKQDQFWNTSLKAAFIKDISTLWSKDYILPTRSQTNLAYQAKQSWALSFNKS